MSINAYSVIDSKMGKASFNLYRDMNLADFLDAEIQLYSDIHDGTGMIDVPVKILKKDIQFAKLNKDETVTYYCF